MDERSSQKLGRVRHRNHVLAGRVELHGVDDAGTVAVSYVTQYLTTLAARASLQGVSSMAMQQGGLGLRMPLFLITVPPMAAAFLQGAVWQFVAPQLRTLRQS